MWIFVGCQRSFLKICPAISVAGKQGCNESQLEVDGDLCAGDLKGGNVLMKSTSMYDGHPAALCARLATLACHACWSTTQRTSPPTHTVCSKHLRSP